MKKRLSLLILAILGFSSCVTNFYAQKSPFIDKKRVGNCISNNQIGYWYRYGTGRSYQTPTAKKHRLLF